MGPFGLKRRAEAAADFDERSDIIRLGRPGGVSGGRGSGKFTPTAYALIRAQAAPGGHGADRRGSQDGEEVLEQPAQPVPMGLAGLRSVWPAGAPLAALASAAPVDAATPPQVMAQQLAAGAAPAVTGWVEQIRALVAQAQSLEDIRNGLERLLPDMTLDQYAAAMAQALAAAQLAGRYEVLQEAAGNG